MTPCLCPWNVVWNPSQVHQFANLPNISVRNSLETFQCHIMNVCMMIKAKRSYGSQRRDKTNILAHTGDFMRLRIQGKSPFSIHDLSFSVVEQSNFSSSMPSTMTQSVSLLIANQDENSPSKSSPRSRKVMVLQPCNSRICLSAHVWCRTRGI